MHNNATNDINMHIIADLKPNARYKTSIEMQK